MERPGAPRGARDRRREARRESDPRWLARADVRHRRRRGCRRHRPKRAGICERRGDTRYRPRRAGWGHATGRRQVGFAALLTAALAVVLVLLRVLYRWTRRWVQTWVGIRVGPVRLQSLELLSAERVISLLLAVVRVVRFAVVVVVLYAYVPLVFSLFPWTSGLAERIIAHFVGSAAYIGVGILSYVPNIAVLAIIGALTHYSLRLTRFLFREIESGTIALPGFYSDWAEPSYQIVRFLAVAFAFVVAFPYLPGLSSAAFKGVSVFIGVLFSLGSSSAIANVVAGTILTYMRAFRVGDRVKITDTVGEVVARTLLVTRIRTPKNEDITIPNAMILGSHIVNFSSSPEQEGLILHTTVTIGYNTPWRQVHELLIAAARATQGIETSPQPFVLQTSLGDFYVSYELNAYTLDPLNMARVYSELHQNIQDRFNEAGVEILSPIPSGARREHRHDSLPVPSQGLRRARVPSASDGSRAAVDERVGVRRLPVRSIPATLSGVIPWSTSDTERHGSWQFCSTRESASATSIRASSSTRRTWGSCCRAAATDPRRGTNWRSWRCQATSTRLSSATRPTMSSVSRPTCSTSPSACRT
ncbi:mechanosensitive ion channel family protein [Candidatus Poribacteria bacterium]|nr:mechanosensitive ion channel family protein [Candidatus Poribacteria bacterium]